MKIRTSTLALIAILLAMLSCKKKDEDAAADPANAATSESTLSGAAPSGGGLLTKSVNDVTKDDLTAALVGLGWKSKEVYERTFGQERTLTVIGVKEGETRSLTITLVHVPHGQVRDWRRHNGDFVIETRGNMILGVKFSPADPAESGKILAQLTGK